MTDYSKMTNEDFDKELNEILNDLSIQEIMAIPGVYECVVEELNNDILDNWANEHPELAYPDEYKEEDDDE